MAELKMRALECSNQRSQMHSDIAEYITDGQVRKPGALGIFSVLLLSLGVMRMGPGPIALSLSAQIPKPLGTSQL